MANPTVTVEVPIITIEQDITNPAFSSNIKSSDDDNEDEEGEENGSDEEEEEDEEVEEEEVEMEMTAEEKKAMYEAVKSGDIDAIEDCLDKPNSDINMIWYKENLLMAAIRHGQAETAEFLLDNGVDHTYSTSVVELKETHRGIMLDKYDLTCRQMAYDHGLVDIVQLIDLLQGNVFPFMRPPDRTPRYRRPTSTSVSQLEDSCNNSSDDSSNSESESDEEGSMNSSRKGEQKKKRKKKENDLANGYDVADREGNEAVMTFNDGYEDRSNEGNNVENKIKKKLKSTDNNTKIEIYVKESVKSRETTTRTDADTGHHSFGAYKLKTPALRENNRLFDNQNILSSKRGSYPPQEKDSEKTLKDFILNTKPVANERHLPDIGYGTLPLEMATSNDLPEVKQPRLTRPTNRIWSSKSALAIRRVNSCKHELNNDTQTYTQSRPLKWRKVYTVGSYAAESKLWHTDASRELASSVEITEVTLSPLSSGQRSLPSANKCSSSLSKRALKPGMSSIASFVNVIDIDNTSLSNGKDSAIKTGIQEETFMVSYVRPTMCQTTKKRLSPRFMNSYEVLNFIPEVTSGFNQVPVQH